MSTKTLPSGLVVEVRGLTGKDGSYISNPQLARTNQIEDYLLQNCVVGVVDAGPYDFGNKAIDWGRVLVGDRFAALIQLREATYPGKDYTAKIECPRTLCKNKIEWDLSLTELLDKKTQALAPEDAELFKAGNKFPGIFPGTDKKFTFHLLTGQDEKRIRSRIEQKKTGPKSKQDRQNAFVESIAGRIVEIEGVPKKSDAIFDFLETLPLATLDALLPYLQKHDCGVETEIEIECPKCDGEIRIQLPFDVAFFLPETAKGKMRTKSAIETDPENEPEAST